MARIRYCEESDFDVFILSIVAADFELLGRWVLDVVDLPWLLPEVPGIVAT